MRIIKAAVCLFLILFVPVHAFAEFSLPPEDRRFLEKMERDSIRFFLERSHPETGLTPDSSRPGAPSSIAATGFSLASLAIGQSRGWIPRNEALQQIRKTLQTLRTRAAHEKGFFYHFLDAKTGRRVWRSEASSIDTALLIAGGLVAAEYFPGTDIPRRVREIYERVDWKWMMNGSSLVSHGWKPESGFLPHYWDTYNELIILQALGIGAPKNAIPAEAWEAWDRLEDEYNGKKIVYSHSGSLFTYQYSHAFIDFRDLHDRDINYFENSRKATLANREYSLSFRDQHQGYSENSWGLSACVGPGGYRAYGGKPGAGIQDGTVTPHAVIGSIVFVPELSVPALKFFYEHYAAKLYGPYGFKDSFNLDKKWWSWEYLGIDVGASVLMLENYLTGGGVWQKFMNVPAVRSWIQLCGLQKQPA